MSERVNGLEGFRKEKQYDEVLNTLGRECLREPIIELPTAIDSARGLIQRSVSPQKIEEIYSRLMGIGGIYLTDSKYIDEVDGDNTAAISHRRDLSRLFLTIDPVVSSRTFSAREIGKQLLYEASRRTSRDDWRKWLMLIERQNMEAKNGQRVNINYTTELLDKILHNTEEDLDRNRAVIDWSMETALLQRHGVGDVLGVVDKNMPISERVKIVARAELRLLQARSREIGILLLNPTLSKKERDKMKEDLKNIGDLWG